MEVMERIRNSRRAAIILRFTGLALAVTGIAMNMASGGDFARSSMVFYTIQTNMMSGLMFLILGIMTCVQIKRPITMGGLIYFKRSVRPRGLVTSETGIRGAVAYVKPAFQMAFTFYITVTMVIYWTLLTPYGISTDPYNLATNLILHTAVPILVIMDTLLFMPHGKVKYENAILWLVYPILYYIFLVIRAKFGGYIFIDADGFLMFYPYPFLDPDYLGNSWLLIPVLLGMAAFFSGLGALYIFIDKRLGKAAAKHLATISPVAEMTEEYHMDQAEQGAIEVLDGSDMDNCMVDDDGNNVPNIVRDIDTVIPDDAIDASDQE